MSPRFAKLMGKCLLGFRLQKLGSRAASVSCCNRAVAQILLCVAPSCDFFPIQDHAAHCLALYSQVLGQKPRFGKNDTADCCCDVEGEMWILAQVLPASVSARRCEQKKLLLKFRCGFPNQRSAIVRRGSMSSLASA